MPLATESEKPTGETRPGEAHRVLLAEVARRYFIDERSKVELAAEFGVSRFQIAKLLEEARAAGVVTIEIHDPRLPRSDQEQQIAHLLGVETIRIVRDHGSDTLQKFERVGAATLKLLGEQIRPGMTVGLAWSRALEAGARHLTGLPPCVIVQLTGAFEAGAGASLTGLLLQMNQRANVTTYPLYAPLVVDQVSSAEDIRRQPVVADTLRHADALDIAVVAIGAWSPGESSVWEQVGSDVRDAGSVAGAVAELSGLLLDADGQQVSTPLDGRTIGVSVTQLRAAKKVIGVIYGASRSAAVRAAARSGIFAMLVMDGDLADALTELPKAV